MTPRPLRLWWLSGLAGTALTLNAQPPVYPPAGQPVESTASQPERSSRLTVLGNPADLYDRQLNAPELPLKLLLPMVEDLTGRIILRQQGLPNPDVPIVFKTAPTRGEFLQAVETVLTLNGIALVPLGEKFLKVVPLPNARIEAPPLIEESTLALPSSGQVAAKLFQLQFLRVGEFVPQISNLLNGSVPVMFEKANAVLITESITTLQRIETLIDRVDKPSAAGMTAKFYTLTNGAKASDIVTKLRTFLQPMQAQMGATTSYNADDRTNQIILFGDARQFPLFDELIAKLDVKADPNTRNEVIYLKHADATEVGTLLSNLITNQTRAAQASGGGALRTNQGPRAPEGQPNGPANIPGAIIDAGAPSNEFSTLVNIQPDKRSNAIVASGTLDDIRLIKELIEKIDIILAQVRIEVVIAEVQLSNSNETGISSLGLQLVDGKLTGFTASAVGMTVGGASSGAPNPGFATSPSIDSLFDITGIINLASNSTKTQTKILATPTLTTTHNKEATLFVGESRPGFSQVEATNNVGTSNGNATGLRSSVSYQEAGTRLKITPLIGNDGTVQLKIEQEFNAFGPNVSLGSDLQQAPINKRETNSFVSVKNGEIIVLGGYRTQTKTTSRSRLGPIPIIGDLLGFKSAGVVNNELIVFIRPRVFLNIDSTTADAQTIIDGNKNLRKIEERIMDSTPTTPEEATPSKGFSPLNRRK